MAADRTWEVAAVPHRSAEAHYLHHSKRPNLLAALHRPIPPGWTAREAMLLHLRASGGERKAVVGEVLPSEAETDDAEV